MKRYPGHAVFGRVAYSTGKAAKEYKYKTDSTGRSLSQERPYCKTGTAIDYGVGGFLEIRDILGIRVILIVIGWEEADGYYYITGNGYSRVYYSGDE